MAAKLTDEQFAKVDDAIVERLRKSAKGPDRDAAQALSDAWEQVYSLSQRTVDDRAKRHAAIAAFAFERGLL